MKIRTINPSYEYYWDSYDPYAPIGMHLNHNVPSKYIKVDMTLKEFIKYKLNNIKRCIKKFIRDVM